MRPPPSAEPVGNPDVDPIPLTIEWAGDRIRLIDQRLLPGELVVVEATTVDELCHYIQTLAVRGAPALGAAGAMGIALAWVRAEDLDAAADRLIATRPTAVNLAWGVGQARAAADPVVAAVEIAAADVRTNRAVGDHGARLLDGMSNVLTHCNAGALACVGYGTALGVIRAANESGPLHVWVDETRPLLQGARLTAWELQRLGIRCTLIVDSMAASVMAAGEVDAVVVGADRVGANGDVANKIGTYSIAVLARHHDIPFHVAAPMSTVDPQTGNGAAITIERRDSSEVVELAGRRVGPPGIDADNRAFDVTPAALITSWITEAGVFDDPADLLAVRLASD